MSQDTNTCMCEHADYAHARYAEECGLCLCRQFKTAPVPLPALEVWAFSEPMFLGESYILEAKPFTGNLDLCIPFEIGIGVGDIRSIASALPDGAPAQELPSDMHSNARDAIEPKKQA